jgi:hypothetical protein
MKNRKVTKNLGVAPLYGKSNGCFDPESVGYVSAVCGVVLHLELFDDVLQIREGAKPAPPV